MAGSAGFQPASSLSPCGAGRTGKVHRGPAHLPGSRSLDRIRLGGPDRVALPVKHEAPAFHDMGPILCASANAVGPVLPGFVLPQNAPAPPSSAITAFQASIIAKPAFQHP